MSWANITPTAKKYVNNVLDRGWLSRSLYIPRFEQEVARRHGAKHGVAMNSGTDALRISLAILKEVYRWPDHSLIGVPALTFVATVNAVTQNSLSVQLLDVDRYSGNIDLERPGLRVGRNIKAIVPVHLLGLPLSIPRGLSQKIVEDSCETFGVHTIQGDMMCFSFYMSHHVSTGVGGMLITNNDKYADMARSYMNHGRIDDGSHFKFGRSGYSSRMTEMEAALGIAALEHFDTDLIKRRKLARCYMVHLDALSDKLQYTIDDYRNSWMFYPIKLKAGNRDKLLVHLHESGVESREAMPLINQPVFKKLYKHGSCPNAEDWTKNGLLLPLHPQMSEKDVDYVCGKVNEYIRS